ncbi:leucyl/phenylalanyl-tRNA--protein transferase [Morganella morganii]|uniref:leucyl/phenylalanyl-tRNA--protein transferase n=1 Tax=Morganella morganii TaxID=582 RepID=UPI001A20163E|nr:leucyl/phenylalanyl-tRNA--protein transferase [Morganella morganii]MCU6211523.1 leucyl/phenylalanyl-tRNA--protein transferase [Morganella morganii]MCU6225786.1 leucyl/phenylalanyl-tRNA--protein transferase [Morganella morganii]MCU6232956.1 leucyl/phenylalanyl-tRNA--protein transferase [Morganella morganii]HAT1514088.1 leucyl/phenylalanyl-tRNA--protein transferase [Morganella morganii]HAT1525050.1 leucyl/phenylalanyl-tRNA--protein transferase [Morganella morganii]
MPFYQLDEELIFPPVEHALTDPDGLLATGGDLSPARLLLAYREGIFPWYSPGEPILWWSPDPRAVLYPAEVHVSRSLHKILKKHPYRVTLNHAFAQVIRACTERDEGTWIGDDIVAAYSRLHQAGRAHSVEVWDDNTLVGGLYGLNTGSLFCGESMFSRVSNGSKIAFMTFFAHFTGHGGAMFDCQILNHYTESLGAREIPRQTFIRQLYQLRDNHLPQSCWQPQTLARPVPSQLPPFL